MSSIRGTSIIIKSVVKFRTNNAPPYDAKSQEVLRGDRSTIIEKDFSWLRALENLATAKHLGDDHMMTRHGEEVLASRLASEHLFDHIHWISPSSGHDVEEGYGQERKLVAKTCQDSLLRLYQLSLPNLFPLILHDKSLVKAVAVAERLSKGWVIIT